MLSIYGAVAIASMVLGVGLARGLRRWYAALVFTFFASMGDITWLVKFRPYTASQMTYDLRRLRLKGLIFRPPRKNRYFVTLTAGNTLPDEDVAPTRQCVDSTWCGGRNSFAEATECADW